MENLNREICGTALYHKINIQSSGDKYIKNRIKEERFALDVISKKTTSFNQDLITIPVVFHVLHNKEIENISDEQIYSQIEILNRDYRASNHDIIKVPDIWKPLCADTRIEFKLARKDPNGRPTTGITRTHTSIERFVLKQDEKEKIKFTSEGGIDAWDTSRFLNIWVGNIGTDDPDVIMNGYSPYPGIEPALDGVCLLHWVVGDTGTALSDEHPASKSKKRNKGRTAVHEIAHYLNCYHIWGEESAFDVPCLGTDNITDTPNQAGPNTGKPTFPSTSQSCNDTDPNGTMFMNFLDYSDDDSRYMFTKGQMVRMRACLLTSRKSLVQSDVLRSQEEVQMNNTILPPQKVFDGVNRIIDITEIISE